MLIDRSLLLKSLNISTNHFSRVLCKCGFYHKKTFNKNELQKLLECLESCKFQTYKRRLFIFRIKQFLRGEK